MSDAGFRGTLAVSWNAHLPPELIDLLRSDQKDAFNAVMARIDQQAALTELVTELPGDRLDGLSLTWRRVLRIAVSLPPGTKAILEAIVAAGRAPCVSWLLAEAVAPTVRAERGARRLCGYSWSAGAAVLSTLTPWPTGARSLGATEQESGQGAA